MKQVLFLLSVLFLFTSAYAQNKEAVATNNPESQKVTEICGVTFGSSYDNALQMLTDTLGEPDIATNNSSIFYRDKTYEGVVFNSIYFLFSSDAQTSYLSSCIFYYNADTEEEAKEIFNALYEMLSRKFSLTQGEKQVDTVECYQGGTSPIDDDKGFSLSLNQLLESRFSVLLCYGPYEYVREE